jgi:hypothetical protein
MPLSLLLGVSSCRKIEKQPISQTNRVETRNPEDEPYYNIRTRTYQGAWFTINYPDDFMPRNSMRSLTSTEGYDSAFFLSPDGLVEFYIFSPQWNGIPADININRQTEYMLDRDIRKRSDKTEILYTIAAKDGSYKRSYRETRQYDVNWVLGIRYSSQKAYDKYQQAYVRFKESLEQFADGYPG